MEADLIEVKAEDDESLPFRWPSISPPSSNPYPRPFPSPDRTIFPTSDGVVQRRDAIKVSLLRAKCRPQSQKRGITDYCNNITDGEMATQLESLGPACEQLLREVKGEQERAIKALQFLKGGKEFEAVVPLTPFEYERIIQTLSKEEFHMLPLLPHEVSKQSEVVMQSNQELLKIKRRPKLHIKSSHGSAIDSQCAWRGKTYSVVEANCTSKDAEAISDEISGRIFDDRPLLMWFDGKDSPTTLDDSRIFRCKAVNQHAEASSRPDENAMQSPAISYTDIVSEKNTKLPFIKRSPIWEALADMEIFKKTPQQPHFCPLYEAKVDSREGLAIGNMVTFASVVERTSKLQFSDPRSIIHCSLGTLSDLEIHGFDVGPIRSRLNELLSKKERQEQLLEESKGVQMKIAKHTLKKSKIDEEICEINKKTKELQEKLAFAKSRMNMKDGEIATSQLKMDAIHQDIQNAQRDFEGLAAAPW